MAKRKSPQSPRTRARKPAIPPLVQVLDDSFEVRGERYREVVLDHPSPSGALPWPRLPESPVPEASLLKAMLIEGAAEVLYRRKILPITRLQDHRARILNERIEYLEMGRSSIPILFPSREPEAIVRYATLADRWLEHHLDRRGWHEPGSRSVRDELAYAGLLAEKLALRHPGIAVSADYDFELWMDLVEANRRGYEEIRLSYGRSRKAHERILVGAAEEVQKLIG